MKKVIIFLSILIGMIILLWTVGRLTGAVQFFVVPTAGNKPNIQPGDYLLSSYLVAPERFDFVCYHTPHLHDDDQIWVQRLCGMPLDTVQIVNGDLFVNGENADKQFNLCHSYLIPDDQVDSLIQNGIIYDYEAYPLAHTDSTVVQLSDKNAEKLGNPKPYFELAINPQIQKTYGEPWNTNNFGPLVIPEGHYFFLGDNRNMSMDSRMIGLIKEESLYGVVIWIQDL